MSTSRKDRKASCGKNEKRLPQCVEKNLHKAKTVGRETLGKKMTTTKKSTGVNKKKSSEEVNQNDPTHKYLTDPTRKLKKRKKKF